MWIQVITCFDGFVLQFFCFLKIGRHTNAILTYDAQFLLRRCTALLGRTPIPLFGFNVVLDATSPLCIHEAKPVLRFGNPIFCCALNPSPSYRIVSLYSASCCVHESDVELRLAVAVLCRTAIPLK